MAAIVVTVMKTVLALIAGLSGWEKMMMTKKNFDKLSWENNQALAAHMSYGKWKALHYKPSEIKPEAAPEKKFVCLYCGNEFTNNTRRYKKYCSGSCCQNYYVYVTKKGLEQNQEREKK